MAADPQLVQDLARKAYSDFAAQTTLCVVAADDLHAGVGSGVLLRTSEGIPFIVTARHLLEDDLLADGWKPLRVMVPKLGDHGKEFRNIGTAARFCPGEHEAGKPVDVAVVALGPSVHGELAPLAAGIELVATTGEVHPGDVVLLVGLPNYLAFEDPTAAKRFMLSTITYVTGVKTTDRYGRLEVEWSDAAMPDGIKKYPQLDGRDELAEIVPGAQVKLRHPRGVSGGAVWRLPGSEKGELWAPSVHARLIGIPVAYDCRTTEYAESAAKWGTWVHEMAKEIDRGTFR